MNILSKRLRTRPSDLFQRIDLGKLGRTLVLASTTLCLATLPADDASAQTTYYWDTDPTTPGLQTGALGSWDTASPNWNTAIDGTDTPVAWDNIVKSAYFNGTTGASYNISLQNQIQITNLTVQAGNFTFGSDINGPQFNVSGASQNIVINDGETEISVLIAGLTGNATLTKSGNGRLKLSNPSNSFQSKLAITGGALEVSNVGALGTGTELSFNRGTLNVTTGGQTLNKTITLNGAGGEIRNTGTLTASGAITGTGTLFKEGAGTLILSGNNTNYSGNFAINGGTLEVATVDKLGTGTNLGLAYGGTLKVTMGGQDLLTKNIQLTFGGGTIEATAGTLTASGIIGGTGSLTKTGLGTLKLTNTSNSYSGTTNINGSTLEVADVRALGAATSSLNFASGTLRVTMGSQTLAKGINTGSVQGRIETTTGTLTASGAITGTGTLNKDGAGTLKLTGNNIGFSGSIAINGGTLEVATVDKLGTGDTLGLFYNGTLRVTATNQTLNKNIQLNLGGGTIEATTGILTASGNITGTGDLTKTGGGTLILSGTSNNYSGSTNINGGTLEVATVDKLGTGTNLGLSNRGTLKVTATNQTLNKNIQMTAGGGTIDNTGTLTASANITGSSNLIKTGGGTLILSGNNIGYSGNIAINGGTLEVATVDKLGLGTNLNFGGGTLKVTATNQTLNKTIILNTGGGTIDNTGTLTASGIFGLSGLTKTGSGTLKLTRDNFSYSGSTNINGGTLEVATVDNLGNGTNLNFNSGTLKVTTGGQTLNKTINLGPSGGTIEATTGILTASGAITSIGTLNKTGSGTLILSGNNTNYSGAININGGTLEVATVDKLGRVDTNLNFNGGTLKVTTGVQTLEKTINLNTGGGTIDNTGTLTASGNITGTGGLIKAGAGTLNLTGNNTSYSGTTRVAAGVLSLGTTSSLLSTSSIIVESGATLNTIDSTETNVLNDNANVLLNGTLTVDNDETIGSLSGSTGNLNIINNTLTVNQTLGQTFAGTIAGGGNFVKSGTGTLTLSNDNTYTGTTQVNQGILILQNSGSTGQGDVTVSTGATLRGEGGTINGNLTNNGTISSDNTSGLNFSNSGNRFTNNGSITGDVNMLGGDDTLQLSADSVTGSVDGGEGIDTLSFSGTGGSVDASNFSNFETYTVNTSTDNVWTLTGTHAQTTTNINNGVLSVSSSAVFNETASDGATINFNGGRLRTTGTDAINVDELVTVAMSATATIEVMEVGQSTTLSNTVSGDGALNKLGSGTLVLSGSNAYAGGTTVTSGRLEAASEANLGTGDITLAGGELALTTTNTLSKSVNITGNSRLWTASDTTTTLNGVVSGSAALSKTGSGTLVLVSENTYQGDTVVEEGILRIAQEANLGTGNITLAGGELELTATNTLTKDVSLTSDSSLRVAADTTTTFSGELNANNNGLNKEGAGKLVFTTSDIENTNLNINGGSVDMVETSTLGGDVALASGTGFNVLANEVTVDGDITSSGTINVATGNTLNALNISANGGELRMGANSTLTSANITLGSSSTFYAAGMVNGAVMAGGNVQIQASGYAQTGDLTLAATAAVDQSLVSKNRFSTINIDGDLNLTSGSTWRLSVPNEEDVDVDQPIVLAYARRVSGDVNGIKLDDGSPLKTGVLSINPTGDLTITYSYDDNAIQDAIMNNLVNNIPEKDRQDENFNQGLEGLTMVSQAGDLKDIVQSGISSEYKYKLIKLSPTAFKSTVEQIIPSDSRQEVTAPSLVSRGVGQTIRVQLHSSLNARRLGSAAQGAPVVARAWSKDQTQLETQEDGSLFPVDNVRNYNTKPALQGLGVDAAYGQNSTGFVDRPLRFWIRGMGGYDQMKAHTDGDNSFNGYKSMYGGGIFAVEYATNSNFAAGIMGTAALSKSEDDGMADSTIRGQYFGGGAYMAYSDDMFEIMAVASGQSVDVETKRTVATFEESMEGNWLGWQASGNLFGAVTVVENDGFKLAISAGGGVDYLKRPDFMESSKNFHINRQSLVKIDARGEAGFGLEQSLELSDSFVLTPFLRATVNYNQIIKGQTENYRFGTNGASVELTGTTKDRLSGQVTAGIAGAILGDGVDFNLNGTYNQSQVRRLFGGELNVGYSF